MATQPQRHRNCTLNFEDFAALEQKAADCPVCLRHGLDWYCLGADHPRQLGKYLTQSAVSPIHYPVKS